MVSTTSTTVSKVCELHDISFGTDLFFHFTSTRFLAEDSKVDGAMRSFQIFCDNQLINTVQGFSEHSKFVSNVISEDEGFRSYEVYFPLQKTCERSTSAKNHEKTTIRNMRLQNMQGE